MNQRYKHRNSESFQNPDGLPAPVVTTVEENKHISVIEPMNDVCHAMSYPMESPTEFKSCHRLLIGSSQAAVTTCSFDPHEELIWAGNSEGYITSYYGIETMNHSSFRAFLGQEVRQILPTEDCVYILSRNALRCQLRRGIQIFHHCSEYFLDMQCMLQMSPEYLLLGGHQESVVLFDIQRACDVSVMKLDTTNCPILRHQNYYLCSGDTQGNVCLRDPMSLKPMHILNAHSGSLSDFDTHGNYVVTCGFSENVGNQISEHVLKVFDVRSLRPLPPIPVLIEPLLLHFMPTYTSRLAVMSALGQVQLVDISADPNQFQMLQTDTMGAPCYTMDVANSSQTMIVGDDAGVLYVFSSNEAARFNIFSGLTEFADQVDPVDSIPVTADFVPLSGIPFPEPFEALASDWPFDLTSVKPYRRTPAILPEIEEKVKLVGRVGYAPNPSNRKANQVSCHQRNKQDIVRSQNSNNSKNDLNFKIPNRYRKPDIKFSKTIWEDKNTTLFSKNTFSGLEGLLPNSYCNAVLQIYNYTPALRNIILNHSCSRDLCLTCEMNYLFCVLEKSVGMPSQASNFLRVFRTFPKAAALGLIVLDGKQDPECVAQNHMIQGWNRFMIQQIQSDCTLEQTPCELVSEETESPITAKTVETEEANTEKTILRPECEKKWKDDSGETESPINLLFGMTTKVCNLCTKCGLEDVTQHTALQQTLMYPNVDTSNGQSVPQLSFAEILELSLTVENPSTAWCKNCDKFGPIIHTRQLKTLPNILVLNSGLDQTKTLDSWQKLIDVLPKIIHKDDLVKELVSVPKTDGFKKPCRFGTQCSRAGCRFYHPEKEFVMAHENSIEWTEFIPLFITITLYENGTVHVIPYYPEGKGHGSGLMRFHEPSDVQSSPVLQSVKYELTSVVHSVVDQERLGRSHLIAVVKIATEYFEFAGKGALPPKWYIFSDTTVTQGSEEDAVTCNAKWKIPVIIQYQRIDMPVVKAIRNVKKQTAAIVPIEEGAAFNLHENPMMGNLAMTRKRVHVVPPESEFPYLQSKPKEVNVRPTRHREAPQRMPFPFLTGDERVEE